MPDGYERFKSIYHLEQCNFLREGDLLGRDYVPWIHPHQWEVSNEATYGLYLRVMLYVREESKGLSRGQRVDFPVGGRTYHNIDRLLLSEYFHGLYSNLGFQFICFTETGIAFIKL